MRSACSSGVSRPSARASDADRDQVADQLREALAEGRLTPEEHAERIDLVLRARTYAELTPILADLPSAGTTPRPAAMPSRPDLPAPTQQSSSIVTIFGGTERKGRWLVDPQLNVLTICGGVELDFREAVLSQHEVTVNVSCIMGGITIKIPPGVRVINSVTNVLGGVDMGHITTVDPAAPLIRLTGMVLMGGIEVKERAPKADRGDLRNSIRDSVRDRIREDLSDGRRAIQQSRHEHLRDLREARREARRARRTY
jgi:hypothetical protein